MLRWRCAGMLLWQRQSRNALCCRLQRMHANRPSKALCFPASHEFKQRNLELINHFSLCPRGIEMAAAETRRDFRRSQETRAKFWHVAIVSLFFVAVVGSGLFLGAVMVMSTLRGEEENDPTAGRRTARIARSLPDGKLCHYISSSTTGQRPRSRTGLGAATKTSPSQRKNDQPQSAGATSIVVPFTN